MGKIRPIRLDSGVLYVEMEEAELPSHRENTISGGKFEDTPEDAKLVGFQDEVEEAVDTLRTTIGALASDVANALENAAPAEWSLQFNIGFKGKATPIPVLLSGEGNVALKVTATWRRRDE